MGKSIKDYLHLYKDVIVQVKRRNDKIYSVGRMCEITSRSNHPDWIMVWFDDVIAVTSMTWQTSSSNAPSFFFKKDEIKPILRPLSDMTDEEIVVWHDKHYPDFKHESITHKKGFLNIPSTENRYEPNLFLFLLSKHFDLFGLIDAGLAIDKTKLTQPQP